MMGSVAVKAEGQAGGKVSEPSTHHLITGDMEQVLGVVAGGEGLTLQGAGVLELLDVGELGLSVALGDGEPSKEIQKKK